MMLKLTVKDILKQKTYGLIAVISGIVLGTLYYFLTLEMALTHMTAEIELLPVYMAASISLTAVVAVLAGINIALVAYNIKTQRARNLKKKWYKCNIRRGTYCVYTGMPSMHYVVVSCFRDCWRISYFPTSRIRIEIDISCCINIFNLVGNAKYQQCNLLCNERIITKTTYIQKISTNS